jgi:hypothetical protein
MVHEAALAVFTAVNDIVGQTWPRERANSYMHTTTGVLKAITYKHQARRAADADC